MQTSVVPKLLSRRDQVVEDVTRQISRELDRRVDGGAIKLGMINKYGFLVEWPKVEVVAPRGPVVHFALASAFFDEVKRSEDKLSIKLEDPVSAEEVSSAVDLFMAWAFIRGG